MLNYCRVKFIEGKGYPKSMVEMEDKIREMTIGEPITEELRYRLGAYYREWVAHLIATGDCSEEFGEGVYHFLKTHVLLS